VNSVTVWDEPDGWYKITTVYNLVDQNTQTFRVKADSSSDLRGQTPPNEYWTNTLFLGGYFVTRVELQ